MHSGRPVGNVEIERSTLTTGLTPCGPIERYRLRSRSVEISALTYGAIITSVRAPDRDGVVENVVLGHGAADAYCDNPHYLGGIIGRVANRIADATFALDGVTYRLGANEGRHHFHGGHRGFDRHVWNATTSSDDDAASVTFWRISPDGEEGYPGALGVGVTYTLTAAGEIILDYEARAHAPTVVNLTQHSYFNLGGAQCADICGHLLTIHGDRFTTVGPGLVPTGETSSVAGTPFDFSRPARIGGRLAAAHEQLSVAGGFDHNWVLDHGGQELMPAARLYEPRSGRRLDVATTEPGLQFYDGHLLGRGGGDDASLAPYAGLCLETQHYPDSPNQPTFPSTVLRPGESYRSRTSWRLSVA